MTIKAYLRDNFMRAGIDVVLYEDLENGLRRVWAPGAANGFVATADVESDVAPMKLRDDEARALLSALITYYQGGDDTRALRRDYEAERKRVDQFIAHLTREAS